MTPRARLMTVDVDTPAQTALNLMEGHNVNQVPVLRTGQPPLLLTREAIARALSNQVALRGAR